MSWQDYMHMSKKQRQALSRKAAMGDREAIASLKSYTRDIKTEVNSRMRAMRKSNTDYGSAYNNVAFFTETEYGSTRLLSPTELRNDPYDMSLQNEIGIKFLNSKMNSVDSIRETENRRIDSLINLDILPKNIGKTKARRFLRFLGNEEVSAALDEYGESDIAVEMMYDAYQKHGAKGLRVLQEALSEYNEGSILFDEAMERVGIKVEDYRSRRATT